MGLDDVFPWAAFPLGLLLGSFLNVCIHRIPRGISVVSPPSACPLCDERIRWYDNIPVLSFLLLGGRCRSCRSRISWQYPLVEVAGGFLFWAAVRQSADLPAAALTFLLCSILLVIMVIDFRHHVIPDVLTLPGMVLALAARLISDHSFLEGAWGAAAGGGGMLLIAWIYRRVRGRQGVGGGDIKLMAAIGAFLGWRYAILILAWSFVLGAVVGVALLIARKKGRKDKVPFGPFICLATIVSLFFGEALIAWYLGP